MFSKITSKLKDYKEFSSYEKLSAMTEFSNMLIGKSSAKDPSLKQISFIQEDEILENFVHTIIVNKNKYYKHHLEEANTSFDKLKETILEISKKDATVKKILDDALENTNTAFRALANPENICKRFVDYYKVKCSGLISGDNKDEKENNLKFFTDAIHIIVKCMKILLDSSGKLVIIDKSELEKLGGDIYDKDLCLTKEDFDKSEFLCDFYPNFKMYSAIFQKIDPNAKKLIYPYLRDFYGHLVCCIFIYNRCPVSFPDAPGKIFNFGVFMKTIRPYTDLLKPFNFPQEMAIISVSEFAE